MVSLLVTVDVECDMPRWEVEARTTVRNLQGLPRFQALCEKQGVRPTYLCTWPVVTRPEGRFLREYARAGTAEIGAHLHPWTCPPFESNENRLEATHPSRIPASSLEAKMASLTDALHSLTGQAPTAYRAGRFGLNGAGLQVLERQGYKVDTSVTPFTDWRKEGGQDFRDAPEVPYFPDRQQPAKRGASPVLEVPVGIGWSRPLPRLAARALLNAPPQLRLRGILDRLDVTRLVWLYPSRNSAEEMTALAEVMVQRGQPCLNVFFHSSELWPGESPYTATSAAVDAYLDTLERFFAHCRTRLGAVSRTLTEFGAHYLNEV